MDFAQAGMANQSRNWHWDKRKKRYVMLQPGESVTAGKRVRTESGARGGGAGPSGQYKKWLQSSHKKIALAGEVEADSAAKAGAADLTGRLVICSHPICIAHQGCIAYEA